MGRTLTVIIALGALIIIVFSQVTFVVAETNQAIVLQLGEYRYTARDPGLYFKLPFIQEAVYFDRRLLSSDAEPQEYLTLDKKRVIVDHVTRWRIIDPIKFFVSVQNETGARARLDDVVFSELRRTLATYNFDVIIASERENIMELVTIASSQRALDFGIEVIDVRFKRADLPEEVEESVFDRMRAERAREANRYRAEGEEQGAEIMAAADRERIVIVAEAEEQAAQIRGEGDAEAIAIYADALNQDPEFFAFRRRLEAYVKVLKEGDMIVLSPESEFFKYLVDPSPQRDVGATPPVLTPAIEEDE
ncbi:MAG: protease modulator HflC [Chloroflexota bacterium]|nr:protease modulator HflC [Chloroflexota bacterium]MDE2839789.1 protease modulator HflC [Chloroflexota bacterium]MDE2931756.1 protease modulator HflC [Chloroflexota bacterium]